MRESFLSRLSLTGATFVTPSPISRFLRVGWMLVPAVLSAQQPATGVITGRVVARTGSGVSVPARDAAITLAGAAARAVTDADGRFVLRDVAAGPALVRVRLLGFRVVERAVLVPAGDTARVDVALEPEARLLSPIVADARPDDLARFQTRPSLATIAITGAAMEGVPKLGEPDVVRVVQLLPGVVARNDFNTGLNVRGGEADQNLILLDGHPIYNPFHLGGLFSTFMDATVGGIELMTAAFPAQYGGRLSSVLDVRSAEETLPGVNAVLDVSVLGASGKVGGLVRDGRGAWSIAARRTYADAAAAAFSSDVFPYHFQDLHARASYQLANNLRVGVTAYAGRDELDLNLAQVRGDSAPAQARDGAWQFGWGNRVIGASLTRTLNAGVRVPVLGWRLGERAELEQRVSASGFSTLLDVGNGAFMQRSAIRDVRLAGSLSTHTAAHDRALGYELVSHRLRYASLAPETGTAAYDLVQRPRLAVLWYDDLWRVAPRWLIQGGVRAEALSGRNWMALSPRASVKFFATPGLALTAGGGRVSQWLHSLAGDGPLRYFDIWLASDSLIPVATAWHGVVGVERRLGGGAEQVADAGFVRVEAFMKRYDRLLESNASEDPARRGDELFSAEGVSYGADVIARWRPRGDRGPGGWLAYSYAVSTRTRGTERWAPGHDRRHDVDLVATWRLGRYRLGARAGYATGTPYTPIVGQIARRVYDPSEDRWGTGEPRIFIESLGGERHSARFPATHRLDLDASRDFQVRGATVSPYVSVVNAYNARNVFVYLYNYSTDTPTRRAISQLPVVPSLGARVVF